MNGGKLTPSPRNEALRPRRPISPSWPGISSAASLYGIVVAHFGGEREIRPSGSFDIFVAIAAREWAADTTAGGHRPQSRRADADAGGSVRAARLASLPTQTVWGLGSTPAPSLPATR